MRALDWSATPLGPPARWPAPLASAFSLCLGSSLPIAVWWGRELIHLYNEAYRPLLGSEKHPAAMARPGQECWRESWEVAGPLLEQVLATGEATGAEDRRVTSYRNGYEEECYFTFSNAPIRDDAGTVCGVFSLVTETTRRVLAERRLRALYDLSVRTLEAHDPEHACTLAAEVLARHEADLPWGLLYLVDEERKDARLAVRWGDAPDNPEVVPLGADQEQSESSRPVPAALVRVSRTGTPETIAHLRGLAAAAEGATGGAGQSALVLPTAVVPGGRATGVLVVGISPRLALDDDYRAFMETVAARVGGAVANARAHQSEQHARLAAVRADRAKGEFIATLSHEVRAPLQTVRSAVHLLREEGASRALLDWIDKAVQQQVRLVTDLLEMSRLDVGKLHVDARVVDLRAAAEAAIAAVAPESAAAGVDVTLAPGGAALAVADPQRLEQMAWNLVSNAVKFTDRGGRVTVSVARIGRAVTLTVADTGRGLSPEFLPRLFERFAQDTARDRRRRGLGLGLAIVRELADLQGGSVRAASAGVGQGATFTLTFPLSPLLRDASEPPGGAEPPLGGVRVLVVHEHAVARDALLRALDRLGAIASGAPSVRAALDLTHRLSPQVVLAEPSDPDPPGDDPLAGPVRAACRDLGRRVALIALGALGAERAADVLAGGYDAFLPAPADPDELLDVVKRLLAR